MKTREEQIVDIVLELFSEQGPKFKMDDVAAALKISKRTLYETYRSKEQLMILVVKAIFASIEKQVQKIVNHEGYDTLEKLIRMTCAFPDVKDIDYHKAMLMKKDFPKPYQMFIDYIEDNWQISKSLFEQCVEEKHIKPMDHALFRVIILGITKQVLSMDDTDQEALLETCVRTVFDGLKTTE